MRGFSSGARGGSRFARAHLVFGLLRHALHDRVHRVTLDVILLLLRLRADVRDDLFEKRRGGTTVSLSDRGRKNFEGGARRARADAHLARLVVESRLTPELLHRLGVHVVDLHGGRSLRSASAPARIPLPPRATRISFWELGRSDNAQPTNRPKYLPMSASVVALAVALQIDMRWSPCTAASEADGGEPLRLLGAATPPRSWAATASSCSAVFTASISAVTRWCST